MRLIFMGTPEFAVPALTEIVGQGHDVGAVYTRAPAPGGRGMALRPSPVQAAAERFGIDVHTPTSLRGDEAAARFRAHQADVAVVVAYGMILPQSILDGPTLGCLNLHASLLPRWRGAAPMQRAIMTGDSETGAMVMRMESGLDTGPVALAERVDITPEMTAGGLHDRLAPLGADLLVRALAALDRGTLQFRPQATEGVTYAHKIDKAECRIDWDRDAEAVHNQMRGLSPFPGAFFEADLGRGAERIKVLGSAVAQAQGTPGQIVGVSGAEIVVACRSGAVALKRVQRAGKGPVATAEFLRGTAVEIGTNLAAPA